MTSGGRRRALAWLAGMACARVSLAQAPQPGTKPRRIGILAFGRPSVEGGGFANQAIRDGLQARGWTEGRDVVTDHRYADRSVENLERHARELAAQRVDVMVAMNTTAAHAAKKATRDIPIVFATGDPHGLVDNLARPEGNLTGVTNVAHAVTGKQLQLLKEIVTGAVRVAVLVNPDNPATAAFRDAAEGAARSMGLRLAFVTAQDDRGLERAFGELTRAVADALLVQSEALYFFEAKRIVGHAAAQRLPAVYPSSQFPLAGGLCSYGADLVAVYRQLASYVDPILRGAKPSDLPVEQPAKFDLVVNMRTAKALGLAVPPALLARADKVIP